MQCFQQEPTLQVSYGNRTHYQLSALPVQCDYRCRLPVEGSWSPSQATVWRKVGGRRDLWCGLHASGFQTDTPSSLLDHTKMETELQRQGDSPASNCLKTPGP